MKVVPQLPVRLKRGLRSWVKSSQKPYKRTYVHPPRNKRKQAPERFRR
jgi:hypothetical protein